jgi:hypothetical protein
MDKEMDDLWEVRRKQVELLPPDEEFEIPK